MISVSKALAHIYDHAPSFDVEHLPVNKACDRILAENLAAKIDMPPFPASSMDGYAVRSCASGETLTLIGESAAGNPFHQTVSDGQAVRISTGAVLPKGADRILIQENASLRDNAIAVNASPTLGAHIRPAASDFKIGQNLLPSGTHLSPSHITLCAAANHATLAVRRKPKIALISSGNELRKVGSKLNRGEIIAANAIGLKALLEKWGADVSDAGIVKDDMDSINTCLNSLNAFDIIIPIGGASVGDHDHMRPAFKDAGFEIIFNKVAIKPGKPCWFGNRGTQIVLGLPGNPASALVCAHIFLRSLLGLNTSFTQVSLEKPIEENGPRETYLRGTFHLSKGALTIAPNPVQDSYRLKPQANANALIRVPPLGGPYKIGDLVDIMPFGHQAFTW